MHHVPHHVMQEGVAELRERMRHDRAVLRAGGGPPRSKSPQLVQISPQRVAKETRDPDRDRDLDRDPDPHRDRDRDRDRDQHRDRDRDQLPAAWAEPAAVAQPRAWACQASATATAAAEVEAAEEAAAEAEAAAAAEAEAAEAAAAAAAQQQPPPYGVGRAKLGELIPKRSTQRSAPHLESPYAPGGVPVAVSRRMTLTLQVEPHATPRARHAHGTRMARAQHAHGTRTARAQHAHGTCMARAQHAPRPTPRALHSIAARRRWSRALDPRRSRRPKPRCCPTTPARTLRTPRASHSSSSWRDRYATSPSSSRRAAAAPGRPPSCNASLLSSGATAPAPLLLWLQPCAPGLQAHVE